MQKMSRAIYDSSFRRTLSSTPRYVVYNHDSLSDTMPAVTLATCTAGVGKCFPMYQGGADFIEPNPCSEAGNVALVIDLTSHSLPVWAEGLNKCFLKTQS